MFEAQKLLRQSNLTIHVAANLNEAAKIAVEQAIKQPSISLNSFSSNLLNNQSISNDEAIKDKPKKVRHA